MLLIFFMYWSICDITSLLASCGSIFMLVIFFVFQMLLWSQIFCWIFYFELISWLCSTENTTHSPYYLFFWQWLLNVVYAVVSSHSWFNALLWCLPGKSGQETSYIIWCSLYYSDVKIYRIGIWLMLRNWRTFD